MSLVSRRCNSHSSLTLTNILFNMIVCCYIRQAALMKSFMSCSCCCYELSIINDNICYSLQKRLIYQAIFICNRQMGQNSTERTSWLILYIQHSNSYLNLTVFRLSSIYLYSHMWHTSLTPESRWRTEQFNIRNAFRLYIYNRSYKAAINIR